MTETALDIQTLGIEGGRSELALWGAVLDALIRDGQAYWQDREWRGGAEVDREQAFDDLVRCGPMTEHCCAWLDLDPQWISEGFIKWCDMA